MSKISENKYQKYNPKREQYTSSIRTQQRFEYMHCPVKNNYIIILHFTFLFSLFVFVSAPGHYFRIWTYSIWTGQVPALFQIKSIIQQIVHVTSGHMAVYGPVHILPYDPQCHELFAIYIHKQMVNQGKRTNVLRSNMDSQKVLQRESLIGCIESMCAIS